MACFGVPDWTEEEPLIVDVHKMLSDKAWNNFKFSFSYFRRKFLKRSNFVVEVPQNYFVFEQMTQNISDHGRGIKTSPCSENSPRNMLNDKVPTHRPSNPDAITLDTTFSNDTAQKQTYQFKFSKTRTTKVEVSYQKGFTIGGKANFSIGVPKILGDGSVGLETEMQYNITKSEGQSFEESMNIEATSDIAVGPRSNYLANVQLEERTIHVGFHVQTRMSMPQGEVPIYIRRKKDESLVYVYKVKNLKDVFAGEKMCSKVKEGDTIAIDKIDFNIEGFIKGSLACDHRINLKSDETEQEKNMAKVRRYQMTDDD